MVKAARALDARVSVRCGGCPKVSACSIMELLTLGAVQGVEVEVEADGADEDAALRAVAGVFEQGGGI